MNPILQDKKGGKPREYALSMNWNYGFLPRTWENPNLVDDEIGTKVKDFFFFLVFT